MLQETFSNLIFNYSDDKYIVAELWREIEKYYCHNKRHYHNLIHLENIYRELIIVKDEIEEWNTILFTLYYHDIIYNATKSNNEEMSAVIANERMKQLGISGSIISNCNAQIIATKSHLLSENKDTNYFTDADLSILGYDWNSYEEYFKNVRKEYSIYPTFLYNRGRIKVLNHFIDMNKIYKSDYFHEKLELQAKENLKRELDLLRGN